MAAGLLLLWLLQLAMRAQCTGFPAGHPCADPALASKPFCDESLTTAQRAAAMSKSFAEMQADLPREDMPLTPPGLALVAAKNAALNSQQGDPQSESDTAAWGDQPTPNDPGLERLELTAGFGLGCLSACCAVLLTSLRAAWRDGTLVQREVQQGNQVTNDIAISNDIDDASTSELLASLDEIIAASGSYPGGSSSSSSSSSSSRSRGSADGKRPGSVSGSAARTSRVKKDKGGTRSMKNGRGGTSADQTETAELKEVRSLLESLSRSEELSS